MPRGPRASSLTNPSTLRSQFTLCHLLWTASTPRRARLHRAPRQPPRRRGAGGLGPSLPPAPSPPAGAPGPGPGSCRAGAGRGGPVRPRGEQGAEG